MSAIARRLAGAAIGGLVVLLAAPGYAAAPGFRPIDLATKPIGEFMHGSAVTTFGMLEFRGGLALASHNRDFGSLSGLDFASDGKTIYAVADTGYWFTADLVEKDGRLAGLADPRLAPILDAAGKPVATKHRSDAEGLRLVTRDGRQAALVSFERINEVHLFVASPDLAMARARPVTLPAAVHGLVPNKSLEAIAQSPADGPLAGAIVLVAERSLDRDGNHRAFIVGGPRAGTFSVKRSDDFDETDATFLPDGDLVILERKFKFPGGIAMRMRRIAAADIEPGALVDGPILIEATMRDEIDNMEGLTVRRGENGETILLLVSDDNQSFLQRTVLLQFALPPEPGAGAE